MPFIQTTHPHQAQGETRAMYARQQQHHGYVPNYAKAFSHRPQLMRLWGNLLSGIKQPSDQRRFELVTLAAARALRNSYCSLAHAKTLADTVGEAEVEQMLFDSEADPVDAAIVAFAAKVAREPNRITAGDVEQLRHHGLTDAEIFDVVATVAARAFFTTLLDGLGVEADASYQDLPEKLREVLVVGRPLDFEDAARLPQEHATT